LQKLKGEEIRFTSLESSMTLKCSRLITKKELKSGNVRGLKKFKMNNLNKLSSPHFLKALDKLSKVDSKTLVTNMHASPQNSLLVLKQI
jgi:hypothetical protein